MKRFITIYFIFNLLCKNLSGQTAPPADVGNIQQNLKKLSVMGSVLYIAAHPDDENTRLLAYLAQEKHYRTGYLSLTRGDGGQNLIGNEQSELLGLIRTQELIAARRVDGAEQFFTRANDFGFSKGPEETLRIWNKEEVLGDVVWVIRKFRPDVMICRFPTTGEGGHGHHTASAILAQEAFSAAADPKRYPEQLKYVQPWQAKRLLWNTFNFGGNNTTAPDQFKINVGVYNPLLGKSYGELAAESRSNHKTQGFGTAKQRGDALEFFKTILGDAPKTDLMDGVNTTWARVYAGNKYMPELAMLTKNFNAEAPQRSVKALVNLFVSVDSSVFFEKGLQNVRPKQNVISNYQYWHKQKAEELKTLIVQCAGLWFEAYVNEPVYAIGDTINARLQVIKQSNAVITFDGYSTATADAAYQQNNALPQHQLRTINIKIKADKISQPYWLEDAHPVGTYHINDETKAGTPENPDAPGLRFIFTIEGKEITFNRKLVYKYVDPAQGEIYQPLVIAPPVTANIQNNVYIFNNSQAQAIQVKLKAFTKASGSVSLKPVAGWKINPEKISFTDKKKGDEWTESFTISAADSKPNTSVLKVSSTANGKTFSQGILNIRYNHIPAIALFPSSQAKLINIDLKTAGKKIGYITGAGDLIPEALQRVGYEVHQLTEHEIINTDLSGYDAIITGVRAYNVNERLAYEQLKLLEYVKNGGNLVVQYNNNNGLVTRQLGPYPFRVVNERVTDENAVVMQTDKQNPILNYPNTITQADFKGWIQERSLYMLQDIDPQYKTPLQMGDPGETQSNGALIVADYGKGRYIYTSLAFFRELPAGVPGAYRLFVNLLSKPKN